MMNYKTVLEEYSKQLSEWFLTGIKPNVDLILVKEELINSSTLIENRDKYKMINELLDRIEILINIGL